MSLELTLYISGHGLEKDEKLPKSSIESCIVYEQGCKFLVNLVDKKTNIDDYYDAFLTNKQMPSVDILERVSGQLREEKCKKDVVGYKIIRNKSIYAKLKQLIKVGRTSGLLEALFTKLKTYHDAMSGGVYNPPNIETLITIVEDVFTSTDRVMTSDDIKFRTICRSLFITLPQIVPEENFNLFLKDSITQYEESLFGEDLYTCSLYSSFKLVKPVNDKQFFMSQSSETKQDIEYMNYGIYLIDIRETSVVLPSKKKVQDNKQIINLLSEECQLMELKELKSKLKSKLKDDSIFLSEILLVCQGLGFNKVNIIDRTCRTMGNSDSKKLEQLTTDPQDIEWLEAFTKKMSAGNRVEKTPKKRKTPGFRKNKKLKCDKNKNVKNVKSDKRSVKKNKNVKSHRK